MSQIISFHSFRGGTGKSNLVANVGAALAEKGQRVGVIDSDIQSPGIHILFGRSGDEMPQTLNDYLWGNCEIEDTVYDATAALGDVPGCLYLVPASIDPAEITRVLREGYDVHLLNRGFQELSDRLRLDVLLIDTHPGLNEETLLSIVNADTLVIVLRPDAQDYEGTEIALRVARKLEVPHLCLVINKIPRSMNAEHEVARVQDVYECEVMAALPYSEEQMELGSKGIFVRRHPDHPLSEQYRALASALTA